MQKYKLTIAYDGTHYSGWQIQKNARSVQMLIQNALQTVLREKIQLTGAGRTDAGVHALGQVAHFTCTPISSIEKTLLSLNGILPKDIRILSITEVPEDFHARFSAKGKVYHYRISITPSINPLKRHYTTHVPLPIDIDLLRKGAKLFVGTHDFTSFAHEATEGSAARNPQKTLKRVDIIEEPGGIRFEFEGDGFLYKMVRNIVGTLIEVGTGKRSFESIQDTFTLRDRKKAGKTAPPQGLCLMEVVYNPDIPATVSKCETSLSDNPFICG